MSMFSELEEEFVDITDEASGKIGTLGQFQGNL